MVRNWSFQFTYTDKVSGSSEIGMRNVGYGRLLAHLHRFSCFFYEIVIRIETAHLTDTV